MSDPALLAAPQSERLIRTDLADAHDADALAPLFDAYRQFYGAASDVSAARIFLETRLSRKESVILLARVRASSHDDAPPRERGAIVGFAQLYPSFSSVAMGPITILNDLFVAREWRRSRVARTLVSAAAAHAAARGAIRLTLSTQHENRPARRLYESLGFVPDREFTHLSLSLAGIVSAD